MTLTKRLRVVGYECGNHFCSSRWTAKPRSNCCPDCGRDALYAITAWSLPPKAQRAKPARYARARE